MVVVEGGVGTRAHLSHHTSRYQSERGSSARGCRGTSNSTTWCSSPKNRGCPKRRITKGLKLSITKDDRVEEC